MNVLLHICCAPCSVASVDALRGEGLNLTGYWYGPNIHPYTEYKSRRDALVSYAEQISLPLILRDEYGLRDFVRAVYPDLEHRCGVCYRLRMDAAALYAAEHGFDAFSTTLSISPFQDHDLLRAAMERAGETYGVQALYRDFRPLYKEGRERARALGLYMQKYCGCVFSEEERYLKKN